MVLFVFCCSCLASFCLSPYDAMRTLFSVGAHLSVRRKLGPGWELLLPELLQLARLKQLSLILNAQCLFSACYLPTCTSILKEQRLFPQFILHFFTVINEMGRSAICSPLEGEATDPSSEIHLRLKPSPLLLGENLSAHILASVTGVFGRSQEVKSSFRSEF